jgi:DNA mismatch endonuclease, patch repair protein
MDTVTAERRSWVMSLVKSKDTEPERLVRQIASALGYRYRLHGRNLPGRPDLVFAGRRSVIFVHGCFWHQHKKCIRSKRPKGHAAYWNAKLDRNMQRDCQNFRELKRLGWRVLTIWECQLKEPEAVSARIAGLLAGKRHKNA